MRKSAAIAAALAALWSVTAAAAERAVPLKDAAGHDVVEANCGGCHSLDYIGTNAPFMTAKVWEAEVMKMINVFGAPIEPPQAQTIIDYLTRNYGSAG
jgi:sulfite dehydrogenase (cytochrome) subunit B